MGFHLSLSNRKSPKISRTILSILSDLNNDFVWMVSARLLISNSTSLLIKPLEIVPSAQITYGITVSFMFHNLAQFSSKV